jgi:hypothetical protein
MKLKALAVAALMSCAAIVVPAAAHAAPAVTIEVCVIDVRVQTGNPRHSLSGFARLRDGRMLAWSIAANDMSAILGPAGGSITPTVAGAGTGYLPGAEPELVRFIERAAADGAWLRISLDASTGISQKVSTVARAYPAGARCA